MCWSKRLFILSVCFYMISSSCSLQNNNSKSVLKETVRQIDTLSVISELRKDIQNLLNAKDSTFVNDNIFGDCIYAYLNKEFDTNISKKDILNNSNTLFDKYFVQTVNDKTINERIAFFVNDKMGLQWIETYTNQEVNCIRISITVNDDIFEHSRLYWFIRKNGNWVFYGLTCTG